MFRQDWQNILGKNYAKKRVLRRNNQEFAGTSTNVGSILLMRSHFYALLKDLSEQMQLPFEAHLEASCVRFKVDRAYQFGLGLDHSEQFLVFECVLTERRFTEPEFMAFLRLNFAAAYHDGCFLSVDPHSDAVVLISRLPLQGLALQQVVETIEMILNAADRFSSGEPLAIQSASVQPSEFFSKV